MEIALVRRGYSATGGAERYLLRFQEAVEKLGHRCTLITSAAWPKTAQNGAPSWPGRTQILRSIGPIDFANRVEREGRQKYDILFSLERIWSSDIYRAGDGVHAEWLRLRSQFELRWCTWFRQLCERKHAQILKLERSLYADKSRHPRIIANSRMVRNQILQNFGTDPNRVSMIYNGLPDRYWTSISKGERIRARQYFGITPDQKTYLFLGSGWKRKGLARAIKSIAALKQLSASEPVLLVAGSGNQTPYIHLAKKLNCRNVRFLGPIAEPRQCLAAADVFFLPTLYDPFSNACLEAYAAGLPVITTSSNGFSEVIQDGIRGSVIEPGETPDQIAQILLSWADADRRQSMVSLLPSDRDRFSIENNLKQTLALLP